MTAPDSGDSAARVLLIDDQAIVAEAIRRALADDADIQLHHCDDAGAALMRAIELAPTLILQDLVMPGADGISMVRMFRAHPVTRNVPIVVLSTTEDAIVKSAAFAAGASDYIVKLPDRIELAARIRHHSRAYLNQVERDQAYSALQASELRLLESNRELERLSNLDGLTGLSNRRHTNEFLGSEWRRAIRERTSLSLLMIDVDEFKRYNDAYGHLAGDEVLRTVARALQAALNRAADFAGRFGGEEFVVVLPATLLDGAHVIAEKIRSGVEQLDLPHRAATVHKRVTISVGVACAAPQRGDSDCFNVLIDAADTALYDAKHGGRNCVMVRVQQQAAGTSSSARRKSAP
jgi:two-component system chemotaxis family response regulator WspR